MKYLFSLLSFCYFFAFSQTLPLTISVVDNLPEPVTNNAVCEGFINNVPYVFSFGGLDTSLVYSGIHSKSWRYNTEIEQWDTIPPLPDNGKIAMAASRVGDIIYIMGGYYVAQNGSETSSNKVHRYDIVNNVYLADGAPIPVPIDDHVQVVYQDSLIYLITGWSNNQNVNNVQVYNTVSDSWFTATNVPNNNLYETFGSAGTIIGDTIYYHGGARNGANFECTFQMRKGVINPMNPTDISWSVDTLHQTDLSYRAAAFSMEDTAIFLGGSTTTYNFDGIAYNGSGVVSPSYWSLALFPGDSFASQTGLILPMDLRGLARTGTYECYLAGGMFANQDVSNNLLKLTWTKSEPVAIQELNLAGIDIHPNPSNGMLLIENPEFYSEIVVYNTTGHLVYSSAIELEKTVDLTGLQSGVYFAKVLDINGNQSSFKLMID